MLPIVYSRDYECDIGPHVFPTEKFRGVIERLQGMQPMPDIELHTPQACGLEDLLRVHTREYIEDFMNLRSTPAVLKSELPITAEIRDAYLLATGGSILAARLALQHGAVMHVGGGYHHAMPHHAEGFCYLNDVAVAIRTLQAEGVIGRAAVIDTDVHQGNGTARIFQGDDTVFTFSIHQENNYPIKERSDWDIGLADGTPDTPYLQHLQDAVPKILERHRPDLVFMVAGADPFAEDLLGGLGLSLEGLRRRDRLVAGECSRRRIPVVGLTAGGYARNLEDTITIHCQTALELAAYATRRSP